MSTPTTRVWPRRALNAGRGVLMGIAEPVPGVSGGTVALITGIYETILTSAASFIAAVRCAITDPVRGRGWGRARDHWGQVEWGVMIPVGIGMVAAILVSAQVLSAAMEDHPVQMRALFFGLVFASLAVPARMAAHADVPDGGAVRWRGRDVAWAIPAAVGAFAALSLPHAHLEPTLAILVPAGAIAVSALVLPGLSGSFLLLTVGLYEPTLNAVNNRDWAYLGAFFAGCVVGLITVVKVLAWLLTHHRRLTLVILTGVMAGALRALWPWVDDTNRVHAPSGNIGLSIGLAALGFAVVTVVLVVDRRRARRAAPAPVEADAGA